MKPIDLLSLKKLLHKATFLIVSLLLSCWSFAQDKKVEVDVNTKSDNGGNFFMQPWVWIVGGAVFYTAAGSLAEKQPVERLSVNQ